MAWKWLVMWIVLYACGCVRVGEAGQPGPGFDDPEIEAEVESESACGVDECTTDQLAWGHHDQLQRYNSRPNLYRS